MLHVSELARSTQFYCDVLGLKEVGRNPELRIVFLSFGINDHDIGLREAGVASEESAGSRAGLDHIAFRIGADIEDLRRFKARLELLGIAIKRIDEHVAITSIYFSDPDGIALEVYIEHSQESWRGKPQARFARPTQLD